MNEMKKETAERTAARTQAPDDAVEAVKTSRKARKPKQSRARVALMLFMRRHTFFRV